MSIIDTFENETKEIVRPQNHVKRIENFPKITILIFKKRLIEYMKEKYDMEVIAYMNAGEPIPIYKLKYNGKEFAVIRTIIGGAGTAATTEELIAMGTEKVLIYGSCGVLDKNILKGHFVIPTAAYRDEGTSYHYLKPSDYVEVETADTLADIFDKCNIPYIKGKTWTTDAIYRETRKNMEKRKKDGCIVVEMECASIMAVGKFRNIPIYQFVYGDDTLDDIEWDKRELKKESKEIMEKYIIDIGFEVASKIEELNEI